MLEPIKYVLNHKRFILSSESLKKYELLKSVNVKFEIINPQLVEVSKEVANEMAPDEVSLAVAKDKVDYALKHTSLSIRKPDIVLATEKLVTINGSILGARKNADEATDMLTRLQGKEHVVMTGIYMWTAKTTYKLVSTTSVKMSYLTPEVIEHYVASREGMEAKGGFKISGEGATFVEAVNGEYTNIFGFPISKICEELWSIFLEEKLRIDSQLEKRLLRKKGKILFK